MMKTIAKGNCFGSPARQRDFLVFSFCCMCVLVGVTPPWQIKKEGDLKFCTHTPLYYIWVLFKVVLKAASFVKLQGHVDYFCHAGWPTEIRYRPEIWYTRSPRPYQKIFFFNFLEKVTPGRGGALASKNCRVTWIFDFSPRRPSFYRSLYGVLQFFHYIF